MEKHLTFTELILVILNLGLPVFLFGRLIQWIRFRYILKISFIGIMVIWIISQILSLIFTVGIWRFFNGNPMLSFVCLPALFAEVFVLMFSILLKKQILKWA